ncbi:hypothetical protein GQX74_003460 [Glossina fuscipes]|nr:hypothetical protein GQX74_003460 [Glossina fuscipes]
MATKELPRNCTVVAALSNSGARSINSQKNSKLITKLSKEAAMKNLWSCSDCLNPIILLSYKSLENCNGQQTHIEIYHLNMAGCLASCLNSWLAGWLAGWLTD